ncbi:MAG: anthranilate synthase component I family protein, partial [Myxococcales bacterium]|nr:anthranilate synthase component I family protein [Myxococcales bacterium]
MRLISKTRRYRMDCDTALSIFARIRSLSSPSFLLESAEGGENWARFSFMGTGAVATVEGRADGVTLTFAGGETAHYPPGMRSLRDILNVLRTDPQQAWTARRFPGGLVGYVAYDAVRDFESVPDSDPDPSARLFRFLAPEVLCRVDNFRQQVGLTVFGDSHNDDAEARIDARLDEVEGLLMSSDLGEVVRCRPEGGVPEPSPISLTSNCSRQVYEDAVRKAKEYIKAGDIFQVVLSQRFSATGVAHPPLEIYRRLRAENPSPYMFFFEFPDETLIGASPEVMVRLNGATAEVRPIAGTRPRGATLEADLELERDMRDDPKEVSEHIMLLDLGRNDLGRVCQIGSIDIPEQMVTER